jgi:hypothetical protein
MTTIEEIESAIERLPAVELTRLKTWISQRDNTEWDRQMESDSKEGRLDFLFAEAQEDRIQGKLHDWPDKKPDSGQ